MQQDFPHQGPNISKIKFGGGIAGLIFTLGSMLVFLLGIPAFGYFLAGAIALGIGIGTILHQLHR